MLLYEILPEYINESDLSVEELDEALRRGFAVRGGKKVRVKVTKRRSSRRTAKQKRALKKNRRKSRRSGARRKRRKSIKIRKRRSIKAVKGGNRSKSRRG